MSLNTLQLFIAFTITCVTALPEQEDGTIAALCGLGGGLVCGFWQKSNPPQALVPSPFQALNWLECQG